MHYGVILLSWLWISYVCFSYSAASLQHFYIVRLIKLRSLWWILFFLLLIWELSVSSRAASHQRAVNVFGCHPSFCFPHPSIFIYGWGARWPHGVWRHSLFRSELLTSPWENSVEMIIKIRAALLLWHFFPPFFCESITFIHLHQDILKNWPTNPAEREGITIMVSRLCTFFIHAPVSIVRVGCIATGAQLEVAGAGQQQRLRPGESGQKKKNCGEKGGVQL